MRRLPAILLCVLAAATVSSAQQDFFLGAVGGISTLSADAESMVSPFSSHVSLYEPNNGGAFWLLGGRHFNDFLSIQASYGWNRNRLTLTSTRNEESESGYYEQVRTASMHTAVAELLLYFRDRESLVRPYLSVGAGVLRLTSGTGCIHETRGTLSAPGAFRSSEPALRVAVGIDLTIRAGWDFRYIFSETISGNPVSSELTPPGEHFLKHFQNLFGLVKRF